VRNLKTKGFENIILKKREELNLLDFKQVDEFFNKNKPEYVFLAAALVGGIMANKTRKADFIYQNLQIQNNIIFNSNKYEVKKLLFLGSSCVYPRNCIQPIKEEYFMNGAPEETNGAYAIAKIAGIKMCQSFNDQYGTNYISVMPTNLYGPNDSFDLNNCHVIPATIRKCYEAKINQKNEIVIWGTGNAYREFMHVDDMADACIFLMEKYNSSDIINIGTGKDLTIKELVELIKKISNFTGNIVWDNTKPDGNPKKQLNVDKLLSLGWKPKVNLEEGIKKECEWFEKNYNKQNL